MAESRVAESGVAEPGARSRAYDGLRAYVLIVGMWVRSTMAYRTSFLMMAFGNLRRGMSVRPIDALVS